MRNSGFELSAAVSASSFPADERVTHQRGIPIDIGRHAREPDDPGPCPRSGTGPSVETKNLLPLLCAFPASLPGVKLLTRASLLASATTAALFVHSRQQTAQPCPQ